MTNLFRRWLAGLAAAALLLAPLEAARAQSIDTTSSGLQLLLMGSGLHSNDWGTQTNSNLSRIESALVGVTTISTTGGTTTLTDDQARARVLQISGTLVSNATIVVPSRVKEWRILNSTTGAFVVQVKTSGGTAVTIPATPSYLTVLTDGTSIVLPGFMVGSNNLSEIASASTARTNLGLGDAATHAASDFALSTTTISPGTGLSGGGTLGANRTLTLVNTAVTPGTYSAAKVTVDAQGRLTAASSSNFLAMAVAYSAQNNATTPLTKWDVTVGGVTLVDGNGFTVTNNAGYTCTINFGTTGAAALDTGTIGTSRWLYTYLISDGTNWSCLGSASATAPTMPGGYTYKLRTGAIYVTGSGNLINAGQVASYTQYISTSWPTFSGTLNITSQAPPTALKMRLHVRAFNGNFGTLFVNGQSLAQGFASSTVTLDIPGETVLLGGNPVVSTGTGYIEGWYDSVAVF